MPCGCCHQHPVCVNEPFSSFKSQGTQAGWWEEEGGKEAGDPVGVQLGERDGGDEAADLSELSLQGFRGGSLILVQQIPRTIDPDETTDSIQQASPGRADVEASSPVLVRSGGAGQGVAVLDGVEAISPITQRSPMAPSSPVTPRQQGAGGGEPLSPIAPRLPITPSASLSPRPQGGGGDPLSISPALAPSSQDSVQPLSISPAPCEEDHHCNSRSSSLPRFALFSPRQGGQEEQGGLHLRGTASQLVGLGLLVSAPMAPLPLPSSPAFVYDRSAMLATNMLHLVVENPALLHMWASSMAEGVPRGRRDCLDLAGKLPLCLKALEIGIDPSRLMIDDASQAGGVYCWASSWGG